MDKSPDAFRTISEVAEQLDTPAHVLRFWESRFPQIRPVKRAGGRRYYRPSDVALLAGIKKLLHEDGVTIRGVQKILREQGVRHVAGLSDFGPLPDADVEAALARDFAIAATVADAVAPAPTAQVISLEAALARAEARVVPEFVEPDTHQAEAQEDMSDAEIAEAPFVEAEEAPLPEPVMLHGAGLPADAVPDTPVVPPDAPEQPVETSEEIRLAMRLRQVDPASVAHQREVLGALHDRLLNLRARIAKGVRRRAR